MDAHDVVDAHLHDVQPPAARISPYQACESAARPVRPVRRQYELWDGRCAVRCVSWIHRRPNLTVISSPTDTQPPRLIEMVSTAIMATKDYNIPIVDAKGTPFPLPILNAIAYFLDFTLEMLSWKPEGRNHATFPTQLSIRSFPLT
ncbi:hypothetical protein BC936DRAFT_144608 [Jimgerdemannia flammicorona]|uniref:Uncharacterized protein n=1 Tax=Jimgerdemannia flammicorona TaxID=994334 RepID=A0A433DC62_9FUNG|nr:hypothetical protein BC936DRAFT_144608 [Jimgerdemannia flammicorona]